MSTGLLWVSQKNRIHKSNPWAKVQTHGSDHWLTGLLSVSLGSRLNFLAYRLIFSDYWIWVLAHWLVSLDLLDYESRIPSEPHMTDFWLTGLGLRLIFFGSHSTIYKLDYRIAVRLTDDSTKSKSGGTGTNETPKLILQLINKIERQFGRHVVDCSLDWISRIRGGENLNTSSIVHKTAITEKQNYNEHTIQTTL